MNSGIYIGKVYHSFRQGEGDDTLHNVIDFLKKNKKIWSLIPKILSLVEIILVMSATNASSEGAFSMRRVKCYLHTTMLNHSLNHLMTCTFHMDLVEELNLKQVTNDLVGRVERCSSSFGLFSKKQ